MQINEGENDGNCEEDGRQGHTREKDTCQEGGRAQG